MTTAIVLETRRGNFALALALGLILLGMAFILNFTLYHMERRGAGGP
jgi:tungstate transport system permease protein